MTPTQTKDLAMTQTNSDSAKDTAARGRTRREPFFMVTKADVRALEEECDRRQLALTRSVYFALVELANDNRRHGPTFELPCKDVAAKAGVGTTVLNNAVKVLCTAGLLEVEGGKRGLPNQLDAALGRRRG
jgi:hypothetical protein